MFSQHSAILGWQVRKKGNEPIDQEQAGSTWQSANPINHRSSGLLCPGVTHTTLPGDGMEEQA